MEFLVLLFLTLLNGFFSLSELALLSARRPRLQHAANEGKKGARIALGLLADQSRLLSTVQVGVTFAGTVAGAYGGATLAEDHVEPWLASFDALAPYAPELALTLVILLVGYLSLVLGELVPKRLALRSPDRLAIFVAPPMRLMATLTRPLIWLLSASTEGILRLFGAHGSTRSTISDEEVQILVAEGQEAGVFEPSEAKMVKGALGLDDRDLASLMAPRMDVTVIDVNAPADRLQQILTSGGHDRYPVVDGAPDTLLGVVHVRDFLSLPITAETLRERIRPPLLVPVTLSGLMLLERFKAEGGHFALVVDEYGSFLGIVTLHDIFEALIGELPAEGGPETAWVTELSDGVLLVDGALPIAELWPLLSLPPLPADAEYRTVGGMVAHQLQRVPRPGDLVELAGWRIEVTDVDRHRVDALRITRVARP